MEMFFALALPWIGAQGRARFRRKLENLTNDDTDATEFTTDTYPFHLDDEDAQELGTAAMKSSHLTNFHLDVSGMTRRGNGCKTLIPFLEQSKSIKSVKFEGNCETPGTTRETTYSTNQLLHAIQNNPHNNVKEVKLVGTHFSKLRLQQLLTSSQSNSIKSFGMVRCWDSATSAMCQTAATALHDNQTIEDLTLVQIQNENLLVALLDKGVYDHTTISKLHLGGSGDLSTNVTMSIRKVLDSSSCQIQFLGFCQTNWSSANIQPLVDGLVGSKVKGLFLHNCQFQDMECMQIFKSLFRSSDQQQQTLKELYIDESLESSQMLGELLTSLHRNTTLETLDISKNTCNPLESSVHIRDLLRRNRFLKRLDIDRNSFGNFNGAIQNITNGLRINKSLTHIDLSACDLQNNGVNQIFQALSQHPTLQRLVLCANSITDANGLQNVETMLRGCPTITTLVLNGNDFGDEGATVLATMLRQNTTLEVLCIDSCSITGTGAVSILQSLTINTKLQRLEMEGIDMSNFENAQAVEEICTRLADTLPNIRNLKYLTFSVGDEPEQYQNNAPAHLQQLILKGFEQNTSLEAVCCPGPQHWFLEQTKKQRKRLEYYILRNSILPFINNSDGNNDDDDDESSPAVPRGLFPYLFGRFRDHHCVNSAIFHTLRSRPDLVTGRSTTTATTPATTAVATAATATTTTTTEAAAASSSSTNTEMPPRKRRRVRRT